MSTVPMNAKGVWSGDKINVAGLVVTVIKSTVIGIDPDNITFVRLTGHIGDSNEEVFLVLPPDVVLQVEVRRINNGYNDTPNRKERR